VKRILLVLTVALVMAAVLVVMAAPAFARASEFISSPTTNTTTLSLSQPNANPGDPYVPPNPIRLAPTDPYRNVPINSTTCDFSGTSPTCPSLHD
jgi:hypothetical protein